MLRRRREALACRSGNCNLLTCRIVVVLLLIPPRFSSFLLPLQHHGRSTTAVSASSGESFSPLIPEPNPIAATDGVSVAGVPYRTVLEDVLVPLYPPADLPARVSLSRSEGYWPYIQSSENNGVPPQELTYGEFDFYFFAQLLDRALDFSNATTSWQDCVFTDLGSGTGRLVLAAAALHPQWKLCRGIELLQGLHAFAEERQPSLANAPAAPIAFHCGSILDPYMYFGDSDLVFCFSTCMDQTLLEQTAQAIGRQCRPGTVVITTDYKLPTTGTIPPVDKDDRVPYGEFRLHCVDEVEGWCWLTGGASTAYIHVVEASLWTKTAEPLDPPVQSLEDIALEVVELYEAGELTDTTAFKRKVYNDMVFHGIPERFYPKL